MLNIYRVKQKKFKLHIFLMYIKAKPSQEVCFVNLRHILFTTQLTTLSIFIKSIYQKYQYAHFGWEMKLWLTINPGW